MHISFILTSLLLISFSSFSLCGQKKSSRDAEDVVLIKKEIRSAFDEGIRINTIMLKLLEPHKKDPSLKKLAISYQNQLNDFLHCSQECEKHRKPMSINSGNSSQDEITYYETLHASTKELNRRNLIASSKLLALLPID